MAVKFNRRIWKNVHREVKKQIVKETERVKTEATRLILETEKTGRVYGNHQASASGEPFASGTGNALNLIQTRFEDDYLTGIVNSGAEYAAALEFGTEKMHPRPVMQPAILNREKNIKRNVKNAVKRGINA